MRIRLLYLAAFSLCLTFVAATTALAHTQVAETEPAEGASLQRAPQRVSLEFDGPVEAEFSPLEVYDERGKRVDLDDARLSSGDTTLTAGLREGLGGGEYTVEYRYTGVDGHPIDGSYDFSVSGDYKPPEAAGGAGGEGQESGGGGALTVVLYGALGLGALAAVGAFARRRL